MYAYYAIVSRVIDGDSVVCDIDLGFDIWMKDQPIRLFGVDAPETRTSDKVEEVFGEYTKDKVAQFLKAGSTVELLSMSFRPEKDKYGRVLGDFVVSNPVNGSNIMLSSYLVDAHLAIPYNSDKTLRQELHLANRKILIENGSIEMTLKEAGIL